MDNVVQEYIDMFVRDIKEWEKVNGPYKRNSSKTFEELLTDAVESVNSKK